MNNQKQQIYENENLAQNQLGHLRLIGICVYTANVKQKIIWFAQVVCSVKTMMQMLHTQKQPPTLKDLSDWISHQQLYSFKRSIKSCYLKNDAKFYKSYTNQFSNMKIERAEKNYRQKKLISQKKFLVQNKVVAQQFRVAARVL